MKKLKRKVADLFGVNLSDVNCKFVKLKLVSLESQLNKNNLSTNSRIELENKLAVLKNAYKAMNCFW